MSRLLFKTVITNRHDTQVTPDTFLEFSGPQNCQKRFLDFSSSSAIWAPAKTSDILEQLHQDIDTWYHHETLRNDRGDTKTMTLDTHVRLILLQTLNPQERWGTHKKRWPFQPRLFADVIGLVRCSYIYIYIHIYIFIIHLMKMTVPCCFKFAWNIEVRETLKSFEVLRALVPSVGFVCET